MVGPIELGYQSILRKTNSACRVALFIMLINTFAYSCSSVPTRDQVGGIHQRVDVR